MKKAAYAVLSAFLLAVFAFIACSCKIADFEEEYILSLTYKDNFKILQLADIQVDSSEACLSAFAEIDKTVYKEKPDLIVLTGDNIDYYAKQGTFETLVEQMEKYCVYWAPVFGNHDDEQDESSGITKEYMSRAFESARFCLYHRGPSDIHGMGNYVINLLNESRTEIAYSLIFMDSNTYRDYDSGRSWDYIYSDQIDWYEKTVNVITWHNRNKIVPSLAFFHIPLMEFEKAKALQLQNGNLGWGELREEMGAPLINTGMFEKMRELGSCVGVICGHAHINNCDLLYEGIHLICGLKSSKYSYYNEDMLGCTVYTLNKEGFSSRNVGFAT